MTRIDFHLPSLGADMESATLVEWLKKPGDAVHRGETLAAVETDKGIIDIECFDDGTVAELTVAPGTRVRVGAVLAHLDVEAVAGVTPAPQPVPTPPPSGPIGAPPRAPSPAAGPSVPQVAPAHGARARISPAARRRAQELGVPLDVLERSGGGAVLHVEDVERLAAQQPAAAPVPSSPAAPAAPADARSVMRIAIGNAMARSKREIPHYYLAHSLDFTAAQEWLTAYNAHIAVKERLVDAVLIIKAVAVAATRVEGFNGYYREGRFEKADHVHVGAAIAVRGGGLVAPALLDADRKSLATLMQDLSDLVTRVRAGHMRSGEFTAATITVTSLGAEGVDVLYPIINPPQVAIVGTGALRDQPWARAGQVTVRPVLTLALAGDHRVTDGRIGARFLRAVGGLLASPAAL